MPTPQKTATPNFDRINPSLCINAKLRRLHRLLNTAYQKMLKPFGLRGSMLSILFIIGKQERINQKFIADALVLDQSTMSRDVKKLERDGLIRISKGVDPRHSELELTVQGEQLLEEISPVWEAMHQKVEQILGQYNVQQIDALTVAIKNNLDEIS